MTSKNIVRKEISLKELQSAAQCITYLRASGRINRYQQKMLIHALMAGDKQGNLWTIGAQTGKWYRKQGEGWVEGQPAEGLFLAVPEMALKKAEESLEELKMVLTLKAYEAEARFKSSRPKPKYCPNCGVTLTENAHFCAACGKAVPAELQKPIDKPQPEKCSVCGNIIEGQAAFCNKCGARLR